MTITTILGPQCGSSDSDSNTVYIALGAGIGGAILLVLLVILIGGYCYYSNRRRSQYEPISK